jgi:hypothetical protein
MLNVIRKYIFVLLVLFGSCSDKYSRLSELKSEEEKELQPIEDTISVNDDSQSNIGKYAVSVFDTPILNTPDFKKVYGGSNGKTLSFSKSGLIKELEYVAFPGTVYLILDEFKAGDHSIFEVATENYQIILGGSSIYVDSRFVKVQKEKPEGQLIKVPPKKEIYKFLDNALGAAYVWGGNTIKGVPRMLELYKPAGELPPEVMNHWYIKGVDCSGLIYEATNGYTPRNTHTMVKYGEGLKIAGKGPKEIAKMVDSLDMIVWKGHVIYVYDSHTTIESAHSAGGVVMKDLVKRLTALMKKREPADEWDDSKGDIFVVRRWW